MTEKEKMLAQAWFNANHDKDLLHERIIAKELCHRFNHLSPKDTETQHQILKQLIPTHNETMTILEPFHVDYGYNISIGDHSFLNHHVYLMDGAPINIGQYCFIGPFTGMYTNQHPLNATERNKGLEKALPITIEDNVWIGAQVTILGGVTIGEGSVIGAGSVINKDVPPYSVVAGLPARVIKTIERG